MKRKVIRVDGPPDAVDVGEGWESWNAAIGARVGEIAPAVHPDYHGKELWCDEEALLMNRPLNPVASLIADQAIFGDVILFEQGDIE